MTAETYWKEIGRYKDIITPENENKLKAFFLEMFKTLAEENKEKCPECNESLICPNC